MAETLSLDAVVAEGGAHVEKVVRRNTTLFLVQAVLMVIQLVEGAIGWMAWSLRKSVA
jgi:hypothetical protein